jgi:hypothetical protein
MSIATGFSLPYTIYLFMCEVFVSSSSGLSYAASLASGFGFIDASYSAMSTDLRGAAELNEGTMCSVDMVAYS